MGTKNLSHLQPPRWLAMALTGFVLLFLLNAAETFAQRPQFRKWNLGAVESISPLNAMSGLPTLRGHYRNFSAEVSPYPFCWGLATTYHLPVWTILKKIHFNIDATLFAARQNGDYWVTFPFFQHMNNQNNVGLLAGPSVYFLKRCSLQGMLGAAWISQYGEHEFQHFPGTKNYIFEQAALSFEVRLFNNFAQ
jgi:hypothetical protein